MDQRRRGRWFLPLALLLAGCKSDLARPDPPVDEGIYGYANGCVAVEGFDGEHAPTHLAASGDPGAFAFSEPTQDTASRFFMRPSDLGSYLFHDQEKRYLSAEAGPDGAWRLTRVSTLE